MFCNPKTNLRHIFYAMALVGWPLLVTSPAIAQEEIMEEEMMEEEIEEILVTGSRIPRKDFTATSPVITLDAEAIEQTGANHVASFINELPAVGVPPTSDTNSNFTTTASGVSQVNLRDLGADRTLVLVNGRRHIGGVAGSPTVDVAMIPTQLVDRVEIVTGSASAVYGSEATAGVINFIYKRDFEGVGLDVRLATSEAGNADESDFGIVFGSNFGDDDRGNVVAYLSYSDRGILNSGDRAISAHDLNNSSFGPKGSFSPAGSFITLNTTTGQWDKPFVPAEDGFDRNAVRLIRVPTKRVQFNVNLNYQINDYINFFNETSYSDVRASSRLEPTIVGQFISIGNIDNLSLPANNPFIPDELRALIPSGAQQITFRRRFTELGPRTSNAQRRIFRTALGIDGKYKNIGYEVYYQYGSFVQDQVNGGVFNTLNFLNALDVESDGAGGHQCVNVLARSLGCTPINLFGGANSITGAPLAWVSTDAQLTARMEQEVFSATAYTTIATLPAGDLDIAVGFESRKEESSFNSDSLVQTGITSGNTTPNTKGQYTAKEYFVELLVPVLSGVKGAEYLGLELAYRYADYSTVGGVDAYKVAIDWSPLQALRFRGSVATSVRAPNIDELFDPGSETFQSFVDPCALGGKGGQSASGTPADKYEVQSAAVQANCALIPGSATLDPYATNIRSAGGLSAGNPNLTEESSETVSFGFVYTPPQISGLAVTVDYFEIQITDAIRGFGAQETVDQCVRQSGFPNNAFCSLIVRDPVTGLINRLNVLQINAAILEATGVDFTATYDFSIGPGEMTVGLIGAYSLSNEVLPFVGANVVSAQGELGVPDWKINTSVVYRLNKLKVGWSARFIDSVLIENDRPTLGSIGTYTYHDLQVRYAFGSEDSYEVYFGINNILDKKPPFLGQGVPGDVVGTNTAADIYDAIGQFSYLGVKLSF